MTDKGQPDWSPGDVIAADDEGNILLDDGIWTWNPLRAANFLRKQAIEERLKEKPWIDWQNICYLLAGIALGFALAYWVVRWGSSINALLGPPTQGIGTGTQRDYRPFK